MTAKEIVTTLLGLVDAVGALDPNDTDMPVMIRNEGFDPKQEEAVVDDSNLEILKTVLRFLNAGHNATGTFVFIKSVEAAQTALDNGT